MRKLLTKNFQDVFEWLVDGWEVVMRVENEAMRNFSPEGGVALSPKEVRITIERRKK